MTFADAYIKLKMRLNKSSTSDYTSIDRDIATEAINKATNDLIRRLFAGRNQQREGVEETRLRIDDLQSLLKLRKLSFENGKVYSDSPKLPKDYRYFSRLDVLVKDECTNIVTVQSDLREESNVGVLLSSEDTRPSFEFDQCFHTLIDNRIRLYHAGSFIPFEGLLTYYKSPKVYDAEKGDEIFDLKDDVVELIIDEATKIIAGDTQDQYNMQRSMQSVEQNN